VLLIEGVGGLLAPLDGEHTVLDLAGALGYPVLVVARAGLGTLNHTAMTVKLLREGGCGVAGLVVNGWPRVLRVKGDASVRDNPRWLARMNDARVLAKVPACRKGEVDAEKGRLPRGILEAVARVHWAEVLRVPGESMRGD
jgi:dethiobiotin synthetase